VAAKGEHILLREFALINATAFNRKFFLRQMNKIFHSSPYFSTVTALDYHQMLCLLCSDFPKSIITEGIKVLDAESSPLEESKNEDDAGPLLNSYKLTTLQKAIAIFFYYSGMFGFQLNIEFIEKLKEIFQQTASAAVLDINEEISAEKLLTCLQNYLTRVPKNDHYPLPSIEGIMETLACAAGLNSFFEKRTVVFAEDISELISDKISYKVFCQYFMGNYTEIIGIYLEPDPNYGSKTNEKLKDIILQYQYFLILTKLDKL